MTKASLKTMKILGKSLVEHFRGDQKSVNRYVLDSIRNAVIYSPDNQLRDYIDNSGKGYNKPFSYSAIEKTFYSKFIGSSMLETPINYRVDQGENPRTVEITQITQLMSLIANKIYINKYDE